MVFVCQTGRYVVLKENLLPGCKLSCAQQPIKRATFEKFLCQTHTFFIHAESPFSPEDSHFFIKSLILPFSKQLHVFNGLLVFLHAFNY